MLATDVKDAKSKQCEFRSARADDAEKIVAIYESVFGKNGVRAEGHEAYPAPEVFSIEGVLNILEDVQRQFLVAEFEGQIAGGMIVSHNSRFHREFGCVCVGKNFQGQGVSSLMLSHQKQLEMKSSVAINTTEIVTHSLLSQCAHRRAGYDKIIGLGYLQYPRVFFPTHPESCLWITSLEGRVFDLLRSSRQENRSSGKKEMLSNAAVLNAEECQLLNSLNTTRDLFIPDCYKQIVTKIIAQFEDTIAYRVTSYASAPNPNVSSEDAALELDLCGDAPYAFITFSHNNLAAETVNFQQCSKKVRRVNKRYVQARIPVNDPAAIRHIELLRQRGFVFLGLAPLFQYGKEKGFTDVLLMQWIAPTLLEGCGMPGETNCQAKLYGYPLDLVGDIVEVMRRDLSQGNGKKLFEENA